MLLTAVLSVSCCGGTAAPATRSARSTPPEASCCCCWSSEAPAAGSSAQGVTLGTCMADSGSWRAAQVESGRAALQALNVTGREMVLNQWLSGCS